MTLTLLHKRIKFAENMSLWQCTRLEILASKFLVVMGTYRRLSHTVLSCIVSCVRISEKNVWCGNLPVLTFGNCVLKARVINWPVKLYISFYVFTFFLLFKIRNTWLYVFWVVAHVFSNTGRDIAFYANIHNNQLRAVHTTPGSWRVRNTPHAQLETCSICAEFLTQRSATLRNTRVRFPEGFRTYLTAYPLFEGQTQKRSDLSTLVKFCRTQGRSRADDP